MSTHIIPFLKWAGGKRWLINRYPNIFPKTFATYYEPFLGGGSVFFHLQPKRSVLGDLNEELILTYQAIKENWKRVEQILYIHQQFHCKEYYYKIRDTEPDDLFERAARLIYLNRTCFNGIYRVNSQGKFNVPIGTKNKVIYETDNFEKISYLLSTAELRISDFEPLIDESKQYDFIFADPPYTVRHNKNGFIKYNENLFSWDDQIRLAEALYRAKKRGVKIIATNANHPSIREIYQKRGFQLKVVSRFSSISADPTKRNKYEELIIWTNLN